MQKIILESYQQQFPNHTFQQISKQTGIQVTRVFRIFNGSEMKLSEYSQFKSVLEGYRGTNSEFLELFEHALISFPRETLDELKGYLERKYQIYNLKKSFVAESYVA